MNRSAITASNTMGQLQKQIDMISNNMANMNTTGYKKQEANFSELLFQQFDNNPKSELEVGRLTPGGIRYGVGAKLGHMNTQFTQGTIKQTDRPLDVAFTNKDQFFRVRVNNEIHYTRDGSLQTSPVAGDDRIVQLLTSEGYAVLNEKGENIYLPKDAKKITIHKDGSIYATTSEGVTVRDRLSLVNMIKPNLLEKAGSNTYKLPDLEALGYDENEVLRTLGTGEGDLMQGGLEGSNVDMSQEMTNLIQAQRAYQFNSKAIQMSDDMMNLVNSLR